MSEIPEAVLKTARRIACDLHDEFETQQRDGTAEHQCYVISDAILAAAWPLAREVALSPEERDRIGAEYLRRAADELPIDFDARVQLLRRADALDPDGKRIHFPNADAAIAWLQAPDTTKETP